MTATGIKRRHHTNPRVYLRGFAEADKVSIRTRSGVDQTVHISDATVRRNFYNFRTSEGTETSAIEDWLDNSVENPIAPVFTRLRAGGRIIEADAPELAKFVVSQLLRTPTTVATLIHIDGHIGPLLVVQAVLTRHDLDPTRLPRNEMAVLMDAATRAWQQQAGRDQHRSRLRTIMRKIDELADELTRWTWLVLEAPERVLISSDAPVATFHQHGTAWAGIIPPGSPVYLPLSPRHLLVGERHSLGTSTTLRPELAQMVNQVVVRQAADTILKSPSQSWPADLVLLASPPTLPTPTVTWRRDPDSPPTVPATFPEVISADIRAVLDELEATDLVE